MATGFWCPFATAHTRPGIMCNLPTLLKSSVQNLSIGVSAILNVAVFSYFQLKEKTAVFSQRKTEKKKAILQGRLEGLSRFLRYFFIQLKIKTAYKKYCKTRRAWPLLPWKPTYICFSLFRLRSIQVFGFIPVFGVVAGVCRWIKQTIKGSKKAKPGIGFSVMTCFFTALDTALIADRRLFTVLFYLKKSKNSKQKRDVPAVCDGVGRGALGCGYLT